MKKLLALLIAVVLVFSLAACGKDGGGNTPAGDKTPVEGGDLTVGIMADLDASLDPHVSSSSAGTREILFNIYEGLVKPDTEGNLNPAIASEVKVNDTADEYTFTIREGVKFHNGETVTADDVVWSLSRAAGLDTGTPLVGDVAGIAKVEKTDDSTVVVTLKAPDTEFLAHATCAIIPEGNDPLKEVVGTGPFKFVSRSVQENVKLEKNQDYWGEPAHVDTVTLKVIDDGETMVMSLQSGAVDMAVRMDANQVASLQDLNIKEGSSNIVQALYLNNTFEPFKDVRVRQALCYAIDKHAVIELGNDGHGTALGSSMFPAFGKYFMDELTDYYTPDPEKAKALLKEAGYENSLEFTINVPSNMPQHVDTAQVIVEQLKAVGVNAKINQVEWATWLDETYKGRKFEATVVGMDAHGVAASDLLARFNSSSSKNFINFSNADYDAAYQKAISTTDDAAQTEAFKECERILTEQAANVYIQDVASFVVMQNNVDGYEYYPLYVMDLSKIYFTE